MKFNWLYRRTFSYFFIFIFVLLFLYPIPFNLNKIKSKGTHIITHDIKLHIAILNYNLKTFSSANFKNIYDFPFYYPYSKVVKRGVNLYGHSLIVLPLWLLGIRNLVVLYNLLAIFGFFMLSISVFELLKKISGDTVVSLLATLNFTLLSSKYIWYIHINILYFFPSILVMKYIYEIIAEKEKNTIKSYVKILLSLIVQSLFSLNITVVFLVFVLPLWSIPLYLLFNGFKVDKKIFIFSTATVILFLLALYVLLNPYFKTLQVKTQPSISKANIKERVESYLEMYANFFLPQNFLTESFLKKKLSEMTKFGGLFMLPGYLVFLIVYLFFKDVSKREKNRLFEHLSNFYILFLFSPIILRFSDAFISLNILIIIFSLLTLFFTLKFFKVLTVHQKLSLIFLMFFCFFYLRSLYFIIPIEVNPIHLVSRFFPFILRMRSPNFYVYFPIVWLLLITTFSVGIKKRRSLILILLLLLVVEAVPLKSIVHSHNPLALNLKHFKFFSPVNNYPDYYGVIEFPKPLLREYIFNTLYHNKHVYTGVGYGVGKIDPLNIKAFMYKRSIIKLFKSKKFINYMKKNGFFIVVVHKGFQKRLFMKRCEILNRKKCGKRWEKFWEKLLKAIRKHVKNGEVDYIKESDAGIVFSFSQRQKGKNICYTFPTYSIKYKAKLIFLGKLPADKLKIVLNNSIPIDEEYLKRRLNSVEIQLKYLRFNYSSPNRICVTSDSSMEIDKVILK